jgi:phosphohistidine phosphatase
MGAQLKARGLAPDGIVCSPAVRARATARAIAGAVSYPENKIVVREELYDRGTAGIMEVIHVLEAGWNRVVLIGHNPDLMSLINRLAGEDLNHLPTCGVAAIEFQVDDWAQVMDGAGRMTLFDYPKRHAR